VKFGYAIVLALVALVAVTGFAAADRLPQQVPENQIFTIDTLIDVTGAVSEESEMQWTLDSQDLTTVEYAPLDESSMADLDTIAANWANPDEGADYDAADLYAALMRITGVSLYNYNGAVHSVAGFSIPGSVSNDLLIDAVAFPGLTVGDFKAYLTAEDYAMNTVHDYGSIHNSKLNPTEEIMILTWTDSLRSNGGKLSLNKNIDFDSRNKGTGLNNLQVEKVLTYASTEGAHLVGAEEWNLDVAGNYEKTADTIRCVFASADSTYFPAFCNVVKAKSELVNINSAQISTKGAVRSVAATSDVPAALNYQIAVTPDSNSGSGFADGTVKTLFGGSIMEARATNQ